MPRARRARTSRLCAASCRSDPPSAPDIVLESHGPVHPRPPLGHNAGQHKRLMPLGLEFRGDCPTRCPIFTVLSCRRRLLRRLWHQMTKSCQLDRRHSGRCSPAEGAVHYSVRFSACNSAAVERKHITCGARCQHPGREHGECRQRDRSRRHKRAVLRKACPAISSTTAKTSAARPRRHAPLLR